MFILTFYLLGTGPTISPAVEGFAERESFAPPRRLSGLCFVTGCLGLVYCGVERGLGRALVIVYTAAAQRACWLTAGDSWSTAALLLVHRWSIVDSLLVNVRHICLVKSKVVKMCNYYTRGDICPVCHFVSVNMFHMVGPVIRIIPFCIKQVYIH